jgi:hypothetical protein
MKKLFAGIDIGANGGIALINEDCKLICTYQIPKIGGRVSLHDLYEIINSFSVKAPFIKVVIEDLHSIFQVGAKSNWQFGWINGVTETAIVAAGLSYDKIAPKEWQKLCWMGVSPVKINTGKKTAKGEIKYKIDTKATSLLAAKRLFPQASFVASERAKKDHDGIVDAVLLAYYGYLKYK